MGANGNGNGNGNGARATGGRPTRDVRVAIVGTGFSGLGMAIKLRQQGVEDFVVLERADDVGGTWRDNTYPGCKCDVQAHLYSYSFAPNPHWESVFGSRAELYDYLRNCADRYGARSHIRFGTEVQGATWDEATQRWNIETSQGSYTAQVLVSGMGYLSEPKVPSLPGLESFQGTTFHSARWNHDHDLDGRKVAVIGTGASAIQFVPKIQPEVGQLDLYQRTPPWVGPKNDKPNKGLNGWALKHVPGYQRFRRNFNLWGRESLAFAMNRPKMMGPMQENLAHKHLKKSVPDEELRAKLKPEYILGCKRLLFSDTYYPALQEPNVEVVTDGIREITANGVVTEDGTTREVDTIIFGTGFRATDPVYAQYVRGRDGRSLAEVWNEGMSAYKGTTIAGFPNLFVLLGPNTTLGHSSMTLMIEAQIAYVSDCLKKMERKGLASVEVIPEVQEAYNERVQGWLDGSVWNAGGCQSWYKDVRGHNTTIWPTFTWRFRRLTRRFDLGSYETGTPAVTGQREGAGQLVEVTA